MSRLSRTCRLFNFHRYIKPGRCSSNRFNIYEPNSISAAALSTYSFGSSMLHSVNHAGILQADGHLQQQIKEKSQAVVKSIAIYKTPLQQGLRSLRGQGKVAGLFPSTLCHHFVVVVVELADAQHTSQAKQDLVDLNGRQVKIIRAEKVGRNENGENPGIVVKYVNFITEKDFKVIFKADDLSVNISIAQLVKILGGHSPYYDILNDNCWKYANDTTTALLKAFGDLHPAIRPCMKRRLQSMEPPLMPAKMLTYAALTAVAMAFPLRKFVFIPLVKVVFRVLTRF